MIRQATNHDLPDISEIYNDAILNTTAIYAYESKTEAEMEQWFLDKQKAGCPLFIYEEDHKVVAFATYGPFRAHPAYHYTIEHSIYVHPSHRKKGIASNLLDILIKEAKKQNYETMIGVIDSKNQASITLHKRFGFTYCGQLKKVGFKFNRWLDVDFYQLILSNSTSSSKS